MSLAALHTYRQKTFPILFHKTVQGQADWIKSICEHQSSCIWDGDVVFMVKQSGSFSTHILFGMYSSLNSLMFISYDQSTFFHMWVFSTWLEAFSKWYFMYIFCFNSVFTHVSHNLGHIHGLHDLQFLYPFSPSRAVDLCCSYRMTCTSD